MIRMIFRTGASASASARASLGAIALALTTTAIAQDEAAAPATQSVTGDTIAEASAQTPTMSFGEWGVDPALLSSTIAPGDDFFAYVNQEWLDANPLPAEFSRFGAFNLLREKSTSDVKALVDELIAANNRTADEQRIVDAYNAFLNVDAIEAAGLAPAQPFISAINAASDLEALTLLWATPGYPSPVGGYVSVDAKQSDQYAAYIGGSGLGLPDRDYYLDTSEEGRAIQTQYRAYLAFLLGEAGYGDPANAAAAVYALEERLARDVVWDRTISRNRDLTYNAFSRDELIAMGGDFPVATMLAQTGLDASPRFVVAQIPPSESRARELGLDSETLASIGSGLPGMFNVLQTTPLATLQAWTNKSFLSQHADILPKRFDEANFAFYGNILQGTPQQRPRWKRAIDAAESNLGELVGSAYAARYFPPENKAAMDALVVNLRKAMAQSIDGLDWMGDQTKVEARAKLATFDPKIGYRDNLEVYEGLAITPDDPLANRMAAEAWQLADNIAKLGGPIDRTEWFMLPQTVNAYYNSTKNEIVFPAAILQQPFFGMTADPAVNYGAIGGVIGHEIGHGFDDQGSKSDAQGNLRNWWTDADRAAFDKRGDALVEQYGKFCPFDDGTTCLNGRLTLGENIGDVGGLSLAYRAYKIATAGQDVPIIDGFTGDQRFFLAWAQVWRAATREEFARQRIRVGPHSLEEYRVNGVVRNMDAWYEAFGVTQNDPMYLPPEQRVSIW